MIAQNLSEAGNESTSETAVVVAGDYLNKIMGEKVERECKTRLEQGCKQLVVDFSKTEIINSIGISILLGVIDSAENAGTEVIFSHLNEQSIELFEMLGLTKHVTIA